MGGAQPLAVTMNDGVAICVDVDPIRIARRIEHALPRRRGRLARARARARVRGAGCPARRSRSDVLGNAADRRARSCSRWAPRSTSSPTRRARTTRSPTCRSASRSRTGHDGTQGDPGFADARPRSRWRKHVEAMVGFQRAGAEVFDYGNNIRTEALAAGLRGRVRVPRVRARLHPPAVRRGQGAVPLGGAQRRPERHRGDRPRGARAVPRERVAAALDPAGAGARALPGAARPHLLARLRRARRRRASGSTTWSPRASSARRS